jgi:hypothetical protein
MVDIELSAITLFLSADISSITAGILNEQMITFFTYTIGNSSLYEFRRKSKSAKPSPETYGKGREGRGW